MKKLYLVYLSIPLCISIGFFLGTSLNLYGYLSNYPKTKERISKVLAHTYPIHGQQRGFYAFSGINLIKELNIHTKNRRRKVELSREKLIELLKLRPLANTYSGVEFQKFKSFTSNGIYYEFYTAESLWKHNLFFISARRTELKEKKLPVVITIHGHGIGADTVVNLGKKDLQWIKKKLAGEKHGIESAENLMFGYQLVKRGFAVISPSVAFGSPVYEERDITTLLLSAGYSLLSLRLYDLVNVVDFIHENAEQFDRQKIGVMGWSMGGHLSLYLAAVDTRISVAAVIAIFSSYHFYGSHHNDIEMIFPGMLSYLDMDDLVKLCIEKQKLYIELGKSDPAYQAAQKILSPLSELKHPNLFINIHDGGHVIYKDVAFDYLSKYLLNS